MSLPAVSSPMQHSGRQTKRLMLLVIAACLPGVLLSTWFFGYGVLINISVAGLFAIPLEAACVKLRRRDARAAIGDCSALVTAVLFGIAVPPGSPWWLLVIGIFFAIVIAKHAYGGLGQNPFNPAMCGYLLLLLSFPSDMTTWHIPNGGGGNMASLFAWDGLRQSLDAGFPFLTAGGDAMESRLDGMAMATPLTEYGMAGQNALLEARADGLPIFAATSATAWELVNLAYLSGGLLLLALRVISWHIPVSIILTVALLASLFYAPGSGAASGTAYLHLFGSATMIGAFFIATDPVSAATSNYGRIVYGMLIGATIYGLRVWGSYPDSVAVAVLFGNFCAPLLDHYLHPRIYRHKRFPVPSGSDG